MMGDALEAQALRVNGRSGGTGAPRQWTPRVNGRHACLRNDKILLFVQMRLTQLQQFESRNEAGGQIEAE